MPWKAWIGCRHQMTECQRAFFAASSNLHASSTKAEALVFFPFLRTSTRWGIDPASTTHLFTLSSRWLFPPELLNRWSSSPCASKSLPYCLLLSFSNRKAADIYLYLKLLLSEGNLAVKWKDWKEVPTLFSLSSARQDFSVFLRRGCGFERAVLNPSRAELCRHYVLTLVF